MTVFTTKHPFCVCVCVCARVGCMSVVRGAVVTGLAVRTGWSREGSESASRSFRLKNAAGVCVAVTTWTAAHLCAYTQVRRRRPGGGVRGSVFDHVIHLKQNVCRCDPAAGPESLKAPLPQAAEGGASFRRRGGGGHRVARPACGGGAEQPTGTHVAPPSCPRDPETC